MSSIVKSDSRKDVETEIRDILGDIEKCLRCRYCISVCPLYEGWPMQAVGGKLQSAYYLLRWGLEPDEHFRRMLYYCTTCARCSAICPPRIEPQRLVERLRAVLSKKYGMSPLDTQMELADSIRKSANPYGEASKDRFAWLEREPPRKAEYAYFVGCTPAYREQGIAKNTFGLLSKLGIDFSLDMDEACCGAFMISMGLADEAAEIAKKNVGSFRKMGADKVVVSCAGCYKTFKLDYPSILDGFDIEVCHVSEVLDKFINKEGIRLKDTYRGIRVTYHDPCHLGRHAGLFDAPRGVIEAIPGVEFIEMPAHGSSAICCGGGRGLTAGFPRKALEIAKERVREAQEAGAKILLSSCPFCKLNLSQANRVTRAGLEVLDLTEFVSRAL
ncbi:MAG: (Fe-S)-binding protein [Candidatus Bathyarchaeia archaeon]